MFFNFGKKEKAFKEKFVIEKVSVNGSVRYRVLTEATIPGFKKPRMRVIDYTPSDYKAVVKKWYAQNGKNRNYW